jgi:hypothetical protein
MEPGELASHLRAISAAIDDAQEPSRVLVARAVLRLLLATDKSLALSIRDAVVNEIVKLVPGEFGGELYDTNPGGKGFKKGYVSFGLDPQTWEGAGIIGGILFKMNYDASQFSSEAPEPTAPEAKDFKHSKGGGVVQLDVQCGYYNKLIDGSYSLERSLGKIDVLINPQEGVDTIEIKDPGAFASSVQDLIQEISSNPPEHAQSTKLKKKYNAPTGSPQSLLKWLLQNHRTDVTQGELNALAKAMSGKTGRGYQQVLEEVTDFFRKRKWAIKPDEAMAA